MRNGRTVAPSTRNWATTFVAAVLVAGCGGTGTAPPPGAHPSAAYDSALNQLLPDDVREAGVLTVATDASYAPAAFFAADGRTIVGFEPDLLKALSEVLGVDMELVVTDFDEALDDVATKRVDIVVSAMTDSRFRERQADFVNYFSAGTSIVVQRGNPHGITDLADLCGDVVAVERGTVQLGLLRRSRAQCDDPMVIRTRETNADALVELRTGRAAAVLNDYPPAVYLSNAPATRSDFQLASDTQYEPGLYGIAVSKNREQLRDALRAALQRLVTSGQYDDVLEHWDVSEGAVGTITVNAG